MKKIVLLPALLALVLSGCQQNRTAGVKSVAPVREKSYASVQQPECNLTITDFIGKRTPSQAEKMSLEDYDWGTLYRKCPSSGVAAYNYSIALIQSGQAAKAKNVVAAARIAVPDFSPLTELQKRLDSPIDYAVQLADAKFRQWLNRDATHVFNKQPPVKEQPSPLPKLIKGEFEKRADFEARVQQAKEARKKELQGIEARYASAVARFNLEVEQYNRQVRDEKQSRIEQGKAKRQQLLNDTVADVLGELKLADLRYDSELEKFSARVYATGAGYEENITIAVPLAGETARRFKQNAQSLKPYLSFRVSGDGRAVQRQGVKFDGHDYLFELTDSLSPLREISAVAEVDYSPAQEISTIGKVKAEIAIEDDYYAEALTVQDDPALAQLRQQQAEMDRKLKLAQQEQARERERKRIEQEIYQQQLKLANMGGTIGTEYEGLEEKVHWKLEPAVKPAKDTVAVIIGNRSYGDDIPKVYYAYNDAMAVQQFLTSGLGVPQENIIVEKDATKGVMEGIFRKTLPNRITKGKTEVIVYFSGHGMPKNGRALLLPADTKPEFADITGYPREALLAELAALGAKQTTVILDACFSGTAKDSNPLVAGKPVFMEVAPVAMPEKTIFISATRARQIARMDKEKGMSLMTYYLLEGLSGKADTNLDRAVSVAELKNYLEHEVDRKAKLSFNASQIPEVIGPQSYELVHY